MALKHCSVQAGRARCCSSCTSRGPRLPLDGKPCSLGAGGNREAQAGQNNLPTRARGHLLCQGYKGAPRVYPRVAQGLSMMLRSTWLNWAHGIVWVGRDLKDHRVPTPLPLDQVAQGQIQPALERFQGWGIHSSSGQPVPAPHHPHSKEFLPSI